MCNTDNLETKNENNNKNSPTLGSKATFVAGIMLIIIIIEDIWNIYDTIPDVAVVVYVVILWAISFVVLCTKKVDKFLSSKKISNFGDFLTVMSIVVFMIEKTVLRGNDSLPFWEALLIILVLSSIVVGEIYFLSKK